ncbi:MAG: heme exporter protein CcmB [Sphingomonadales bacterium]
MLGTFFTLIHRETLLSWRQGGAGWLVVVFYVMTVSMFPFGVGPDLDILAMIGSGIVWVAALLAAILSLDRMFALDVEDGSLDLLVLSGTPLWLISLAKATGHWLNTMVPVIIVSPVLALVLNLGSEGFATLLLAMLLGTPALSFFGSIAAALTATIKRGGVLIPLLVLPLYIPTLIFGTSAVGEAINGSGGEISSLYYLAAISVFALGLGPLVSAGAIKITME